MPSGEHESPIALAKLYPGLMTALVSQLSGVTVSDYHHARAQPTEVQVLVPRTYHADGATVYYDDSDQPVFAVVLEVQRGWDASKRWTWKLYVAQLEAELGVNVALLAYCPDSAIARRYRGVFEREELSLRLQPYIVTPQDILLVTDPEQARADPALAAFSALCHADKQDIDAAFPALAAALQTLRPEQAVLYYDIVLAGLPSAPRSRWEVFMKTMADYEFFSPWLREAAAHGQAKGKAEGKAEGEGRAVLTVLDARGVHVPDAVREQILSCTDLAQLDTWLRRAITAATAHEVVAP